jgi:hypothetical protein
LVVAVVMLGGCSLLYTHSSPKVSADRRHVTDRCSYKDALFDGVVGGAFAGLTTWLIVKLRESGGMGAGAVIAPGFLGIAYTGSAVFGTVATVLCNGELDDAVSFRDTYERTVRAVASNDCALVARLDAKARELDPEGHALLFAHQPPIAACIDQMQPPPKPVPALLAPAQQQHEREHEHPTQALEQARREFEACRTQRIAAMKKAYAIADVEARGNALLAIPACERPAP